ncbi:MAG: D-alanine-D-alanine ligase [Solirubrobacteraceae bacterium]|jgi:D-alanine-D-alanine ligase|nr:D-alanine-D-alanine ligase [Solirubrobacteraceae bacterium]
MRVAVLAGGRSSEHDVSLASAAGVSDGLAAAGHHVVAVTVARDGRWTHAGAELELRAGGGLLECDVVFPALHGPYGEDGVVQGLLECLDVPYVGAGVLASAVCMDKVLFKDLMGPAGVPQVAYAAVREADWRVGAGSVLGALGALGLPVFVKPAHLGSSVGIAKVVDPGGLPPALERAFEHDPLAIVEAMAGGLEVECSVLDGDPARASLPGEIVLSCEWYDQAAKYEPGGMELVVPARISPAAARRVAALAVEAFDRVGASGLARADFFVDGETVLLNELNTMPGFTATSVFAKLWEASGLPYPTLVEELCHLGVERHRRERGYRF